jgi:hypothetical protein
MDDIAIGKPNNNTILKICCSRVDEECIKCIVFLYLNKKLKNMQNYKSFNLITGDSLFAKFELSDLVSGIILLVISLVVLCVCLLCMVKVLNSMLK